MTHPLDHLRSKFLVRCAGDLGLLEGTDLESPSDAARLAVHRLAGTAGMFGWEALGQLAMTIDDQLHAGEPIEPPKFDALLTQLRSLASQRQA
jgi:HPt (histidine-containing phosphotransfer) domain-containing protein